MSSRAELYLEFHSFDTLLTLDEPVARIGNPTAVIPNPAIPEKNATWKTVTLSVAKNTPPTSSAEEPIIVIISPVFLCF